MTFSNSTPSVKHPGGEKSIRSGGYQRYGRPRENFTTALNAQRIEGG